MNSHITHPPYSKVAVSPLHSYAEVLWNALGSVVDAVVAGGPKLQRPDVAECSRKIPPHE